jgi:hypothetical protein
LPRVGEKAAVVLVDLETAEEKVVAETAGWEPQMGANINWGASDEETDFQRRRPIHLETRHRQTQPAHRRQ